MCLSNGTITGIFSYLKGPFCCLKPFYLAYHGKYSQSKADCIQLNGVVQFQCPRVFVLEAANLIIVYRGY